MHPAIRVVCFLLFCVALARPDREQLILAGLLIGSLFFTLSLPQMRQTLNMVRRLRWLLLSVFVIYGWFSPGTPLALPLPESLLPTREGLAAGLPRVITLILILLAAGILLVRTSRQQLIAALYWLLSPVRYLRGSPERLAVRLALTLEYVEQQEAMWRVPPADQVSHRSIRERISHIARHLAGLLPGLFEQAPQQPGRAVSLELLSPPDARQWLWPILLGAALLAGVWVDL